MTRTSRMILTMILAVVLSVVFTVPSFANEASEASDKETVIIRDADAGTVTPEVIAEHTPEMTWEFTHPEEPKAPAATQKKAEETPKPKVSEPAPKETKAPVTEAPATEVPVTEAPATEVPVTEAPVTEAPAAEAPVTQAPAAEAPETGATETEAPAADEPATETPVAAEPAEEAAEEPARETTEEAAEESQDPAEDAEEVPETAEEDPAAEETEEIPEEEASEEVTVRIITTMVDEYTMKLHAVVNDPEGRQYIYQWQVSEDGGENFLDILGATADELQVELTENNRNDMWRIWVQAV